MAYDISKAYKRIERELMESLVRNLERHKAEETEAGYNWDQWQAIQLRELERYRAQNASKFGDDFFEIDIALMDLMNKTYEDAQTWEEAKILEQAGKGISPANAENAAFFGVNDGRMNALIDSTRADFNRAQHSVLRKADDEYRRIIFDAQVFAATGATYEQAVDMATKDFLKNGIQSIVYKNGSRHNISEYAEMAIKTGQKRAYLMGEGNAHDKYGIHTVRVNKRTDACPKCARWCGRVLVDDVYSGGTTEEASAANLPTLSQAMREGFLHPRCKDVTSMYIPGVSKPAEPWTKEELEELAQNYNDEQKLNHAKDMEESYRRMSDLSLDPANKATYKARADQWKGVVDRMEGRTPPTITPPAEPPTVQPAEAPPKPAKKKAEKKPKEAPKLTEEQAREAIKARKEQIDAIGIEKTSAEMDVEDAKFGRTHWNLLGKGGKDRSRDAIAQLIDDANQRPEPWFKDDARAYAYILDHYDDFVNGNVDELIALEEGKAKDIGKRLRKAQKELESDRAALYDIIGEPNTDHLTIYGKKHLAVIKEKLADGPQVARDIWNKAAPDFRTLPSTDWRGRKRPASDAYYSPGEKGVWLSITRAAKEGGHQTPYQVVFHEFAHNMDAIFGQRAGYRKAFTRGYKDGAFGKMVMQEANAHIEAFMQLNGYTDRAAGEKAFCAYIQSKYPALLQRTDISDMFESSMGINYPFGVGHGYVKGTKTRFFERYGKDKAWIDTGSEAFAEMYSAMMSNPESWACIQDMFPESVKIFEEMMEVASKL
jgi:hypothetical protein